MEDAQQMLRALVMLVTLVQHVFPCVIILQPQVRLFVHLEAHALHQVPIFFQTNRSM